MAILKSISREHNRRDRHLRGQAVTEFLLILVISLVMVATLRQIYKPFGQFVTVYFTDYLQCLLETGELPNTPNGICQEIYDSAQARLASAKPNPATALAEAGVDGAGNSRRDEGGRSEGEAKENEQAKNRARRSGGAGQDTGSASGSANGENGSGPELNSGGRRRLAEDRAGRFRRDREGKNNETGYTGSSAVSSGASGSRSGNLGRAPRIPLTGRYEIFDDTRGVSTNPRGRLDRGKEVGGADEERLRPRRSKYDFKTRAPAQSGDDSGLTIGFAFRLVLMAAILIIVVLVIGGQILQVSRADE